MSNFSPYSALFGGSLIGLSAALLMLFNGRIAGISGIVKGLVSFRSEDKSWRLAFVAGLLLAPSFFNVIGLVTPSVHIGGSYPLWIGAGLLVGYGTKLADGCTSGHGVCGLARLSVRSLAATLTFMGVAMITVFVQRHLIA